jgi:signal transduction histidine kinase
MQRRIEELKRNVGFTDDDARQLVDLGARASRDLPEIARRFFERLREHAEGSPRSGGEPAAARDVLDDDEQLGTLLQLHAAWLDGLFSGDYPWAHFSQAQRIGRAHANVGLPLPYFFTAMAEVRSELTSIADAFDPSHAARNAITRLLDLELAMMTESYVTEQGAAFQRDHQEARLTALGKLATGLAHEIRNPLNGALLNVAFVERSLKSSGASADVLEAAHAVKHEIKRLAKLVTDFLEFARPRPVALDATSLRAVCERAVQLLSSHLGETVTLRVDLPASDVLVPADKARLERVLVNLLENAVDAVAPKGGTVVLRARREPGHAWIEVEDDGPGIPDADAPVFEAFYSTKPHGTGLGLAVAHRAVSDHGGTIEVESKPGRTRFRVALPLAHQGASG